MRWRRTGWLGRRDSNLCISKSDLLNFIPPEQDLGVDRAPETFVRSAARASLIRDAQVRVLPPGLRVLANSDSICRGSNPAAPTGQSVSNAYGIGSRSKGQKYRSVKFFCERSWPGQLTVLCAGGPAPRLPVPTVGALAQSKQHSLGRLRGAPCCRGRPLLREHCQCAMDDSGNNGADNRGDHVEPDICEVIGRDHRT
jgi:hypothetical protein